MKQSWLVLVLGAVACGGSSSTGPISIAGMWTFSSTVSNTQLSASCTANGQATVNQSGSTFSGTSTGNTTCSGPGGTASATYSGHFTGGQITGTQLTFADDGGCSYSGAASGSPTNRLAGNVTCSIAVSGTNYTFIGTWQATR